MHQHGTRLYCPQCRTEANSIYEPCNECGYEGERIAECPKCEDQLLKVMMFMGVEPDGYVCEKCKLYFGKDFKVLAQML